MSTTIEDPAEIRDAASRRLAELERARMEDRPVDPGDLRLAQAKYLHAIGREDDAFDLMQEPLRKGGDFEVADLAGRRADLLQRQDPTLSRYDALTRAMRESPDLQRSHQLGERPYRRPDALRKSDAASEARSLLQKAEEIQASDPSLSRFEAMERARRADPEAQARYLASVR